MARVVEHVDAERLPVEVVPERLHAREAAAARDGGGVGRRRRRRLRARVLLDRAPAVVDRLRGTGAAACAKGRALRDSSRSSAISWRPSVKARVPTAAASPSESIGGPARLGERTHAREEGVQVGRGALEVREQRHLLVGQVAQALHRRPQLVEEGREAAQAGAQLAAPAGGDLGGVAGLLDPADHVPLVALELGDHRVRVRDEVLDHAFWSPRIRSVREVSRRPGCARRSTSWRSSGRPASPVPSSVTINRKRSR